MWDTALGGDESLPKVKSGRLGVYLGLGQKGEVSASLITFLEVFNIASGLFAFAGRQWWKNQSASRTKWSGEALNIPGQANFGGSENYIGGTFVAVFWYQYVKSITSTTVFLGIPIKNRNWALIHNFKLRGGLLDPLTSANIEVAGQGQITRCCQRS